jgi:two-component system response regulator HydG
VQAAPALSCPVGARAAGEGQLPASPDEDATRLYGSSPAMARVRELIGRFATSHASVLIQGETGTGKELVAQALHALSPRAGGPFIAIDCAALPTSLLESELFGYSKGAFTDAKATRVGLFAEASGGTLFFDEVAELTLDAQAKLLRALQERKLRPLGSNAEVTFDARVLCATHKNLAQEVAAGRFRQDLYFRLNVLQISLPPLRERGSDVVLLARRLLTKVDSCEAQRAPTLTPELAAALMHHAWPGNVRELESCVENLATLARDGLMSTADLPEAMRHPEASAVTGEAEGEQLITLDELERRYVLRALHLLHHNRSRVAEVLGMDRRTLYRRLETWGLPTS